MAFLWCKYFHIIYLTLSSLPARSANANAIDKTSNEAAEEALDTESVNFEDDEKPTAAVQQFIYDRRLTKHV